jgi:hypothetical protein
MWIEEAEQVAADDGHDLDRLGVRQVGGGRVGIGVGRVGVGERQAPAHNDSATTPRRARILDPQTSGGLITGGSSGC